MAVDDRFDVILNQIFAEVKNQKRGVLYKTINLLDPVNAEDICQVFEIRELAYLNDDIKVLERISIFRDVLNFLDPEWINMRNNFNLYEKFKYPVEWIRGVNMDNLIVRIIIGIGLVLTALYLLNRFLNQSNRSALPAKLPVVDNFKRNAILCLVVPANRIDSSLHDIIILNKELDLEQTEKLIDKSVYFITYLEGDTELDEYTRKLNFSDVQIDYADDRDIYIKLLLPCGEDVIIGETKGSISRRLSGIPIIQEIRPLKNLDNINRFKH